MSEFVDECRREWRRRGVPDPVANEMAADLAADLAEAAAEGASPQDVLGDSAFDPRGLAAEWAIARGVTSDRHGRRAWRPLGLVGAAAAVGFVLVVVGLAGVRSAGRSVALAVPRPGLLRRYPFGAARVMAVTAHPVVLTVLALGVLAVGGIAGMVVVYRTMWSGSRRDRRPGRPTTPDWS